MSDWHRELARDDFDRARTREFLSRIASLLDPARDRLLPFEEVRALLKPLGEVYEGLQSVSIDRVIGSEGRYRDFNRRFLPRMERLRTRWVSIDRAHYDEVPLPPVRLYELGGLYFVRDGNHRISVAALRGQTQIDAEITSLGAEARLHPGMTIDQLRREVIAWEKRSFYESTSFAGLTGDGDLDFSSPGRYDEILEHINVHKYFINQHGSAELPFWQALVSWYGNVYQPIAGAIVETDILPAFPGRTVSDLYVYIVRHWDELKKKSGLSYPLDKAALDFANRFGQPSRSLILRFLAWMRARRP
ncbi:MAG: transcriptional regulator [Spirochaetota bacterium]